MLQPGDKVFGTNMTTYGVNINKELEKLASKERGAHIWRHTFAAWPRLYGRCGRSRVRELESLRVQQASPPGPE